MATGSSETRQSHPHSPPNVSPRRKPSQQITSHCKHWSLALVRNIHKSASPVKRGSKRQHGVFFFLSTKRETWPRAQEANSMWKEKQTHRCKNQSREETGCWETSDWYAGKKPTSWYIDGLDRDGMVKERILLLPSLSTISCQVKDKKKNRKKKLNQCLNWKQFCFTKTSLKIFWVLGYNCETNRWPGQTLFLPVLLMIEVIVTDWRVIYVGERTTWQLLHCT